jgi:flagellin
VIQVTNSATAGKVAFTGTAAALAASAVTLQIAGVAGTQQLSFAGSTKLSAIAAAINNITTNTGVTASANGTNLTFKASDFGAGQFVSVQAISPGSTFTVTGGTNGKASGKDAIVSVNGAAATVDGTKVTYRDNNLDVSFTLSAALNNGKTKTFGITGGGATFSLGSKVTDTLKASLGIQSVSTGSLGDATLGFLNSLSSGGANAVTSTSLTNAQKIVDEATNQVSSLRGRLGAFQKYTLGSSINSLGVAYENIQAATSAITDTNFSTETANLTRAQILQQASTTVLSTANSAPQVALTLLQHA